MIGETVLLRVSVRHGDEYRPAVVVKDNADGTQELHVFVEPGYIFPEGAGVTYYPGLPVARRASEGTALGQWKRR